MMATCDRCGTIDELDNMFYHKDGTMTECICEGCAERFIDAIPVKDIEKTLTSNK